LFCSCEKNAVCEEEENANRSCERKYLHDDERNWEDEIDTFLIERVGVKR